ncbi:MAG: hypothetical protein COW88_03490 [Candidatus Lloydbacteria bacterium CG22_combo_CG10-13_8_21_14_all_47_15]|uniref:Cytochrome b5 heme-binding domain-containing protein n=1 Tax=Candidatus Lloydbacteria bacterium CG22_combo_CG10-13_8_21_14_all_47_15 TaxID=1974635 RepID=A0A2H0CUF0_9BACT|nr:MAG: hypothetical protein COW88_03490 [Candidatus Lloydbacteria bacterium CG22_combo_CG10-13_8_21_14_all_47_15]
MNKNYIGVIIILVIIVGAVSLGVFFGEKGPARETAHSDDHNTAGNLPLYALAQVGEHASADDCWLAVDGHVYDVTSYVSGGSHPGEQGALISGCGNDETERFGKIHSQRAAEELEQFIIGTLE